MLKRIWTKTRNGLVLFVAATVFAGLGIGLVGLISPGRADAGTTFLVASNAGTSTVGSTLGSGALSLTLAGGGGANFPSTYPYHVVIGGTEIVRVNNRITDVLTIVRAQEGTADIGHSTGETVYLNVTAQYVTEIQDAVNGLEDGTTEITQVDLPDGMTILQGDDDDWQYGWDGSDFVMKDASGNVMATFSDAGTVGNLAIGGSFTSGSSATVSTLICNGAATIGGGYGSTGVTISTTGNIQANGVLVVDGAISANGAVMTSDDATFALLNTTPTTINFGGNATTMAIGKTGGSVVFPGDIELNGDLAIDGGDAAIGEDHVTKGTLSIFGDNNIDSPMIDFYNAGNEDGSVDVWTLIANGTAFTMNTDIPTTPFSLDSTGNLTLAAGLVATTTGSFGGGYGSTGVTISAAGVIQGNGTATFDGLTTIGGTLDLDGNAITAAGDLPITPAGGDGMLVGQWSIGDLLADPERHLVLYEASGSGVNASFVNDNSGTTASNGAQFGLNSAEEFQFIQWGNLDMFFATNGITPDVVLEADGDFVLPNGIFRFQEITTPAALADYGTLYTKADNMLYFQDGAGTESPVGGALDAPAFAGLWTHLVPADEYAFAIATQDTWIKYDDFKVEDHVDGSGNVTTDLANNKLVVGTDGGGIYRLTCAISAETASSAKLFFYGIARDFASPPAITDFTLDPTTVVTTSADHDLEIGDSIIISGSTSAEIDGHFMIATTPLSTTFTMDDFAGVTVASTVAGSAGSIDTEVHGSLILHRYHATGADVGAITISGMYELEAGDDVYVVVLNNTDATNSVIQSVSLNITRAGLE